MEVARETLLWPLEARAAGEAFRQRLGPEDARAVRHAQAWFLASQYTAMCLYYAGTAERPTKFPASISYTASKGLPKYAFLLLWLRGWSLFLGVFWAMGETGALAFALQMITTGFITFGFNKPGQSHTANLVHMVGAVVYIADHLILLAFLDMAWVYRIVFHGSFALSGVALHSTGVIKKAIGLPPKYASTASEWRSMLAVAAKAGAQWPLRLWCSELAFMFFENLIFTSFVVGMNSGLPAST